jgi:predicted transcriptional regulator
MPDPLRARASHLEAIFGPLEIRVLEALWAHDGLASVRDLQPSFPAVAYTTLMTTLDRLFRKGVLARSKSGRAYHYRPHWTRTELQSQLAESVLATLLPGESAAVRPLLSMFVDAVGHKDRALLDELEQLVRVRRDALKGQK